MMGAPHASSAACQPEPPSTAELQACLATFLEYCAGDVILWHDANGACEPLLEGLALPSDVVLVREDALTCFELKERVCDLAPDERLLVHRARLAGVRADDWLADVEALGDDFDLALFDAADFEGLEPPRRGEQEGAGAAPCRDGASEADGRASHEGAAGEFEDGAQAHGPGGDKPGAGESGAGEPSEREPILVADGFDTLARALARDWYAEDAFRAAVAAVMPDQSELPLDILARQTGFRVVGTSVLRRRFRTLASYFDSLFSGLVVQEGDLPDGLASDREFKAWLQQRRQTMSIVPCGPGEWLTRRGLGELGITSGTVREFYEGARRACLADGARRFTVRWLRRHAPGLELLNYYESDELCEAALLAQGSPFVAARVCKVRVFSLPPESPKGRYLVADLVGGQAPLALDDLVDELADEYGISCSRAQATSLVRASGSYLRQGSNRVYESYEQFLEGLSDQ